MTIWPIILLLLAAAPAFAERELHVVAVRAGWTEPGDFRNAPRARVIVDRPGAQVTLVLLGRDEVDWRVETTPESRIETVILGGATAQAKLRLNDVRFSLPQDAALPYIRTILGQKFRQFLNQLSAQTGLTRITSFRSIYEADPAGLRVDRIDHRPPLATEYLRDSVGSIEGMPQALLNQLGRTGQDRAQASFDASGMTVTDADGSRHYPVPPDLPAPFLPSGAYFDAVNDVLYGISVGGVGTLYQVDAQTGEWQILGTLDGYDGASLLYDRTDDLFVLTGAFSRPGRIRILRRGAVLATTNIEVRRFPGLTDLFDYPDAQAPSLVPLAFAEDWLLAEAQSEDPPTATRLYAVNVATEEVRLLRYFNR
ncbi:hypothetical protein N9W17_03370 [Jannaschia sp.]|nr:hypothetical protein [Jannaschia sp.]